MLLGRGFSYADAHRARLGVNYKQIPVNAPVVARAQLQQGRRDADQNVSDPVYAPNSKGGPQADPPAPRRPAGTPTATWCAAAYTLHAEDDDWGQAGTLVREVIDDAARDRLVSNVAGHLLNGVTEPVLRIEAAVRGGQGS
jgi:catalase